LKVKSQSEKAKVFLAMVHQVGTSKNKIQIKCIGDLQIPVHIESQQILL
jgi:hypothetical protein